MSIRPSSRTDDVEQLGRFLYRPIVFEQPERVVDPASWLEHIPFAFWIVEALRPAVFVELGTHSGNSYAAFAQAVQTLGLPTACYAVDTWRGDLQAGLYDEGVFTEWSAYHDCHFSAFSGLIRSTFAEAAEHFLEGSIDLLHLDGYHTYESARADIELWRGKLSRRGVILMHDINVRERDFGAWRLWEELKTEAPAFEFLHGHGLGVLAAGSDLPEALKWLLSITSTSPLEVSAVRQFFARVGGAVAARFAAGKVDRGLRADTQKQAERFADIEVRATQEIAQLTEELRSLRERLTESDLHASQAALRTSELEGQLVRARQDHETALSRMTRLAAEQQRREREVALGLKTRFAAQLREKLRRESERQQQVEARLAAELQETRARFDRVVAVAEQSQAQHEVQSSRWLKAVRYMQKIARMPAALGLLPTAGRASIRPALELLGHPTKLRDAYWVAVSGLFDESYYCRSHADVAESRMTPLAHFVLRGAQEGRNPHPLFDAAYYLWSNPDVASAGANPLAHYRSRGAFEGRNPHPLFDVRYYLWKNPDVKSAGAEPLSHFLNWGVADRRDPNPNFDCWHYLRRHPEVAISHANPLVHFVLEGGNDRSQSARDGLPTDAPLAPALERRFEDRFDDLGPTSQVGEVPAWHGGVVAEPLAQVELRVRSLSPARSERPVVLCLSHVMPWPPRAGNEYRIYRMLRWLRDKGYRIVPVIAPLPGDCIEPDGVRALADQFSNAVLCDRNGRLEYVLRDVPDVLSSLRGEFAQPIATLLDEDIPRGAHGQQLLETDRVFCHDALITTVLRLQQVLGPHVLLAQYIWMSRILPLVPNDVVKIIDTIDVFSSKRDKVLRFGIDDLHVEAHEEAARLRGADLILAIQPEEQRELQKLLPGKRIVTAGVDFDVVRDPGIPSGRRILYVASDNRMNKKGLADFLRFAWPHIRGEVPDAELLVAGKVSHTLDAEVPGVIRLGPVDDLAPLYRQARVVINPAVAGTGVKIKSLEALCHFRPLVTWPSGTDGFTPELAALCVTARDWYEFSRRVADLIAAEDPILFSQTERDTIVRLTSPATVYREMTDAIESLWTERVGSTLAP